ncbi:MAG: sulfotransferase [Proteobacteria bacterium]|nr:sulfotransferase [Pseudomonadota bacterium]
MNPQRNLLRLPDFIIIGAMKSATSTLFEQLSRQPGIFMCEPKEPNYFSDDRQFHKGINWYAELFNKAPEDALLGEASTHYTKLPTHPSTVERMLDSVPDAKLIYVMRHPIDRLISHYMHEWSMGVIRCDIDVAVERYPELIAYSQYAMQLEPFLKGYGAQSILPVFFERISCRPQQEFERICRHIGYRGVPVWNQGMQPANVSAERLRRFPLYNFIFKPELAARLRRRLVPQGWRNWIKRKLTMRERPVLNASVRASLEQIFDKDLEQLGEWLGGDLKCGNFKELTATRELSFDCGAFPKVIR